MAGMNCSSCGTENPRGARFCMSCGAALEPKCPNCGAENPPEAKFCIECGTGARLAPPSRRRIGARPRASRRRRAGLEPVLPEERRKATVLFADLSGYTAVAERMDPEAVKSLVDRALRRLGQEVERYGGRVDKYIGDNVMAVFGAPVAHEDDPERAVRAGLAMQAAMDEINERARGRRRRSASSCASGSTPARCSRASVGDEYTVMGDAVNVAARLQAAARPGQRHRRRGAPTALTRDAIEYERAGAARAQGQVRAGAGVGGRPGAASEAGAARRARARRR